MTIRSDKEVIIFRELTCRARQTVVRQKGTNHTMISGNEVKVFRSVDDIGRDSIDSIADDGFFTYEWFKTLETQESFDVSPLYLTVYDQSKLIAFAPCFVDVSDHYFIDGPKTMPFMKSVLNLGQRLGLCQNHVLLCYSPFCLRSKVLFSENCEEKLILKLLSEKIDELCEKEKVLFSSFLFVSEFDQLLMENLQDFAYIKSAGTTTFHLNVQWSNFEDYLKSLKHKVRLNIRREIKKCTQNGVAIEASEFEDLSAKLSELLSRHILKYAKNAENIFYPSFFRRLNEYARDKTKVFIAEKNNEVVGFSLCLRQGETLDVWMCGFEYDALTNTDFVYFNLAYYAPIQWAIEEGIKKIYYRRKSDKVKMNRGCKPERTYSFVKCHNKFLRVLINSMLKNTLYS